MRSRGRESRRHSQRPAALSLLAADPASAQDRWRQQVANQLDRAVNVTGTSGYVQTHGPIINSLRSGERTTISMRLEGGVEYRIVGVCDNDCSDVDLKLSGGGSVLVQDVATDDLPIPHLHARIHPGVLSRGHHGHLQGERRSWTVRLNAGATYRLVGVCDNDCSDLDLKLYAGDATVAQDVLVDDVPGLNFTPATTRDYTLEVIMASCSVNPCRYGVAGYGR